MTSKLRWLVPFVALAAIAWLPQPAPLLRRRCAAGRCSHDARYDPATTKVLVANKIVPLPTAAPTSTSNDVVRPVDRLWVPDLGWAPRRRHARPD